MGARQTSLVFFFFLGWWVGVVMGGNMANMSLEFV